MSKEIKVKICKQCGKEFENRKHPDVKYCSRQCFYDSRKSETVTKICPICGISFTTRNDKAHCSKKCFNKRKRERIELKCLTCGKTFYKPPSQKSKYCSPDCRPPSNITSKCQQCGKEFIRRRGNANIYCSWNCYVKNTSNKEICKCQYCHKEFETHRSEPHKYCSVVCANLSSRKCITINCLQCGKEFSVPLHEINTRKYCSMECATHFRRRINYEVYKQRKEREACGEQHKTPGKFPTDCVICSKTMLVYRCRQQVTKTCSQKCHRKWISIQSSKRKNKTHELECEYCGRIFEMWECRINGGRRFCSNTCYHASTSPTIPEKLVSEYLTINNITFKEQVKIGRYHIDFLVSDNILIEVYGDYWHAHPDKYDRRSLLPQQKKVYKRDKRRKEFLTQKSYKFFSVWERDIKKNVRLALEDAISEYQQLRLF